MVRVINLEPLMYMNNHHAAEVVEKMLFADDNEFEQRLPYVRRRCAGDSDPEINFYKKRHAYCKCKPIQCKSV